MQKSQKRNPEKKIVLFLAILLALSIAVLCVFLYRYIFRGASSTAQIPDNIIMTKEKDTPTVLAVNTAFFKTNEMPGEIWQAGKNNNPHLALSAGQGGALATTGAVTIDLYKKNTEDNEPFYAQDMLPGDSVTQNFCVIVSYQDQVTVCYHADIQPGYEQLAEALKVKVVLLSSGETLYNGLMRDMPASLNCTLTSADSTDAELYYEITTYLDSSVGNEHQNCELSADFRWWVQGTDVDNLNPPPQTGDTTYFMLWIVIALVAAVILAVIAIARHKRASYER